jgi:uncharacterized protein YggU (UPF0235/DUF167 family)
MSNSGCPNSFFKQGSANAQKGQLPPGIRAKNSSVDINNLNSDLVDQFDEIVDIYRASGIKKDVVITSGNDSRHKANSLHFSDKAVDLRSNYLTDKTQLSLATDLQVKLGKNFTVISEHFVNKSNNHIHIEVDITSDASNASVYKQRGFNRSF